MRICLLPKLRSEDRAACDIQDWNPVVTETNKIDRWVGEAGKAHADGHEDGDGSIDPHVLCICVCM